jgi:hypothetical protein
MMQPINSLPVDLDVPAPKKPANLDDIVVEHDKPSGELFKSLVPAGDFSALGLTRAQIREKIAALKPDDDEDEPEPPKPRWKPGGLYRWVNGQPEVRFATDEKGASLEAALPNRSEVRNWLRDQRRGGIDPETGRTRKGLRAQRKAEARRLFRERKELERRFRGKDREGAA